MVMFCALSAANISWIAHDRLMFGGIDGFDFDHSNSAPSGSIDVFFMIDRPLGDTFIKASNEFRIERDIYKSTSFYQVRTEHPSAQIEAAGAFMLSTATLSVSKRTTLRIDHDLTGYFTDRDQFTIQLTNDIDDSTVFELLSPPTSDFTFITLLPGQYTLSEAYNISGTLMPEPRNRHFATSISVTVVPAPATLTALSPIGILATRRRR